MLKHFSISIPGVLEGGIMSVKLHVKMHLFDIHGWFASDLPLPFLQIWFYVQTSITYASKRCVQVNNLTEVLNASKVKKNNDPYAKYRTEVLCSIPVLEGFWTGFSSYGTTERLAWLIFLWH